MDRRVLLTGGSGFVGRNILPSLRERYMVFAPTRSELDIADDEAVRRFVSAKHIDVVIHSANPNPVKNAVQDSVVDMFEGGLRLFTNMYRMQDECEKILYFGSGAEFDKRKDISSVRELDFGYHIPADLYGFSKFIMNELSLTSRAVYNLRIFACYGPYDHESKFIAHCIHCALRGEPITIRRDCYFDYLQVNDLGLIVPWFIENKLAFHDYNVTSGTRVLLSDIAKTVLDLMELKLDIIIGQKGLNNEYTGNNQRLLTEMGSEATFTDLRAGIEELIGFERKSYR